MISMLAGEVSEATTKLMLSILRVLATVDGTILICLKLETPDSLLLKNKVTLLSGLSLKLPLLSETILPT